MNVDDDFEGVRGWYGFVGAVEELGSGKWESRMGIPSISMANVVFREGLGGRSRDEEGQREVSASSERLWGLEGSSRHIWTEHR